MDISALAEILGDTVQRAPDGEVVVSIHLFGIRYASELKGHSLKELVRMAHIPASYHTEIHKGMRLAEYVTLK